MTFEELLKACGDQGKLPRVKINISNRYSKVTTGTIDQIRADGCGVRFDGMNYSKWFYKGNQHDKCTNCMQELILLNE